MDDHKRKSPFSKEKGDFYDIRTRKNYSPSFLKMFFTPDTAPSTASLASSATSLAFEATFSAAPSA